MVESKPSSQQRTRLITTTGEIYQPIRLHYELFNQGRLLKIFDKLDCVGFDPPRQRWIWVYTGEARTLKFKRSYEDVPDEWREIALGYFFIRRSGDFIKTDQELLLDLRSFERTVAAVEFFDRQIPRTVARLAFFDVVNRIFSGVERPADDFDYFFEREEVLKANPFALIEAIEKLDGNAPDFEARRLAFLAETEARMDRPRPEVERLPADYYEDGIEAFRKSFMVRQTQSLMEWEEGRKLSFREFFTRIQRAEKKVL
jgi:hypothetical protein